MTTLAERTAHMGPGTDLHLARIYWGRAMGPALDSYHYWVARGDARMSGEAAQRVADYSRRLAESPTEIKFTASQIDWIMEPLGIY